MELDGLRSTLIPPPAVTLTFNLSTPKANQHICESENICVQNLVKFPSMVSEIWYTQSFMRCTDSLTHGRTDPSTEYLRHRFSTVAEP